jgi:ribosomal protein S12 methylthiotransferase accessory factor
MQLRKRYRDGTHRLAQPEDTLRRIEPHLSAIGVTRCADVTGLDRIGVPVWCAIRPRGKTVQVTNGKGLRAVDARVSALMEATEIFHAEEPAEPPLTATMRAMVGAGRTVAHPDRLPHFRSEGYFAPEFLIGWINARELLTGQDVWLPASAVYCTSPTLHDFSSNGLASGNETVEATLHALYELIERDAISRLCTNGVVRIDPERCRCIDLATVTDGPLATLIEMLARAGLKLVLLWVKSCIPVHTFWAILLDRNPFSNSSRVNVGYGTHASTEVAAIRAVTEGAQARLTYIHGAREDVPDQAYFSSEPQERLFASFDQLPGVTAWSSFPDVSQDDLLQEYQYVIGQLAQVGFREIFCANLSRAPYHLPVVKLIIPSLEFNERLF